MADLSSLIRVRKHSVEQKQKVVSELYRQADELENEKTTILTQLNNEFGNTKDMTVEMLSYFGPYAEAIKERAKELEVEAGALEVRIQVAQEEMRAAFSELKKVEITQRNREDAEEKAINKKESDELDAMAIDAFRRKQEEEA